MTSELKEYSRRRGTEYPYNDDLEVDVLIVGAGFGGVFCLKTLREQGYKATIFEAGTSFGGTWRWNRYPGAGVDSEVPEYQFSWPETYKDWCWSTNYPNYQELRAYFDHVDKVCDLSKDCSFETVVVGAQFHTDEGKWHIKTEDGRIAKSKFLITKGKRVAVIGTGASGVQIVQALGPQVSSMTVFQRTPNLAVPMGKRDLTPEEQNRDKPWYYRLYELREKCFGGFFYGMHEKNTFDDTPEQREAFYQKLWDHGGFRFWLGNYKDMLISGPANQEAYKFWAKNVRARIGDARKRDILAPLKMPHYFGIKRPCLEQHYYEEFNRENVDVVDIKDNPIKEFTETGIRLQNGEEFEFDVVAVATGFDITTGGMTNMGLISIGDTTIQDEWRKAAYTYLGTTVSGYPNMFHLYGPHGPTLLSNGPSTVEVQGRWIVDCINKVSREGLKYINPTQEATLEWKKRINQLSDRTLFPTTRSTYMGGSMPGKAFEQVNYAGGIPQYAIEIREALDGWKGFQTVKAA
ncbi:HK97 family phage prohead protease [Clohesyomyces aquaticus]|uniref:HK97 family phage prohead protease n=1 Tax=Clohesyomyces aquaticus TaxID=1231657 RepID=A0A1Y2A3J3_9PLEO|nr:HK97 family phage prohead protease [Clohesyomyces aquaticus]